MIIGWFYYVGYSNPFSENEENNYVIVGVSRVKKIDDTYYYDNTSEEVKRKYSGGFVWQKPVTSTYPNEGFCIPYWKHMDDEDLIERLVIKPQNRCPFKYGSREVTLADVLKKMAAALKDSGVVYTSFKYGDFEGERNGRYFTDFTIEAFKEYILEIPELQIEEYWITGDVRPGRGEEKWLNLILRKKDYH